MKIRYTIRAGMLLVSALCLILAFLYPPIKSTVVVELNSASTNSVRNTIANAVANWYDNNRTKNIESYRQSTLATITENNQLKIEVSSAPFQSKTLEMIASDLGNHLAETYSDRRAIEELASQLEDLVERSKEADSRIRQDHSESVQRLRTILQTYDDPRAGFAETKRDAFISTIGR